VFISIISHIIIYFLVSDYLKKKKIFIEMQIAVDEKQKRLSLCVETGGRGGVRIETSRDFHSALHLLN